jgi:hypothetical protein
VVRRIVELRFRDGKNEKLAVVSDENEQRPWAICLARKADFRPVPQGADVPWYVYLPDTW